MKIITSVGSRLIHLYKATVERQTQASLASGSQGGKISYPFVVSHPELISLGKNTNILGGSRIQLFPEMTCLQSRVQIGKECLIGYRFCILAGEEVIIGDNCSIASDVSIFSENHGIDPSEEKSYGNQQLQVAPVKIGRGCWIGDKVIILPGITIGERSVIGGGAVVTKSIPAYSIAVGNPARVIKKFNFETKKWEKIKDNN